MYQWKWKLGIDITLLVGAEVLWEEEGFLFGFKSWQAWAVSKVLWEWIPNVVSSKAKESAKAMSLAFVLCDFLAGVRRKA